MISTTYKTIKIWKSHAWNWWRIGNDPYITYRTIEEAKTAIDRIIK